ncbi:glycosyltransferase family 2 protein [Haemophilus parainfluenzae]|jgi:putative glycosyltransferase|uniref:glycosyltransferase family 2 protein n=1 Tax=Haemophilus parainfluenzae TaxID=729 RepID=UPI00066E4261|nr:glycosyltransferase family 2 protein [Haemophilus parainfluenzae]MDU5793848.1 glycosyltransferase family 2 protein [Haemophilus parainfluenzae]
MLVTIFTPTYNRGYLLTRLYNSLLDQTDINFEWIIVDDGSTDSTKEIVSSFIEDKRIKVIYEYQNNSGKHVAVNRGIDLALGDYFAIVDSDDYLLPNTIEAIKTAFSNLDLNNKFAGIAFNKGYSPDKYVGETFSGEYLDATSIDRKKYNILGDKFEVFFTKILKENKFPVIDGEKFMSEIVLWTRIAVQGYKIRWFNKIVYICEYLPGGLTDSNDKLIAANYKGYALRIREQVSLANINIKEKMGYYSAYYKNRINKVSVKEIVKELDTNIIILLLSVLARKLMRK